MRNLLLLFMLFFCVSLSYAQSSCSHSLTLTDVSTNITPRLKADIASTSLTGSQRVEYQIDWGDNSTIPTYQMGTTTSLTLYHNYSAFNTYAVKVIVTVVDSTNGIRTVVCVDSTTQNATVATCQSSINIHYDTLFNGKVFFNVSNPQPGNTYTWNFGDGNSNTGASVSHTYATHQNYTVTLTTANGHCTNTQTINNISPINGCSNLAGLMSGTITPSGSNWIGNFNANAYGWQNNVGIICTWDYGDGNSSSTSWANRQTTHTYTQNGQYTVRLIIDLYDSTNSTTICSDTFSKVFYVGPSNIITGNIVLDSVSTVQGDSFKVWLINFDSTTNILSAVDSQIVTKWPSIHKIPYLFNNRPSGSYRTKAAPLNGPTTGTGYIPTYHTSSLLWSNASIINHTGNYVFNKDIVLQKGTVTNGPGFVGGNVSQGANKGTANGIAGINVLLLDAQDKPVLYTMTDANGDYAFNNLPTGTYKVHPELLDFNTTPVTVLLTANSYTVNGMNFERSLSNKTIKPKTSGISEINNQGLMFKVYPNPATNNISISWNNNSHNVAYITITDISGKTVYSAEQKMSTNTQINVAHLQAGLYFLTVEAEYGNNTKKLIIK